MKKTFLDSYYNTEAWNDDSTLTSILPSTKDNSTTTIFTVEQIMANVLRVTREEVPIQLIGYYISLILKLSLAWRWLVTIQKEAIGVTAIVAVGWELLGLPLLEANEQIQQDP